VLSKDALAQHLTNRNGLSNKDYQLKCNSLFNLISLLIIIKDDVKKLIFILFCSEMKILVIFLV